VTLSVIKDLLFEPAAVWGVASKLSQAAGAPLTALLVVIFFTPTIQGYYYSFASLLALQIFLELGLASVITTFSSHEWARLRLDGTGEASGDEQALKRLSGLALASFKWYLVGGFVLFGVLTVGGTAFLELHRESVDIEWRSPWLLLCAASAVSFVITPIWALLQGCGQIDEVYRFRFIDGVCKNVVLWSAIAAGAGLWSAGLSASFSVLFASLFLWMRHRRFLSSLLAVHGLLANWWSEVFPLQWRIAVSWVSGFFAFYLFTPALFYFDGPEAAGRMGITWTIVGGISALASTWAQTRAPRFAQLVADGKFHELDRQALHVGTVGVVVSLASGLAALGALAIAQIYLPGVAARFLPLGPIALFLAADVLHQISVVLSTYLRAFKREPFVVLSLILAVLIAGGTISLTPTLGPTGPAAAYLFAMIIGLIMATRIFTHARKEWTFPKP
jgi:hypothetical protein